MFGVPHTWIKDSGATRPMIGFQAAAGEIIIGDGITSDVFLGDDGNIVSPVDIIIFPFEVLRATWNLSITIEGQWWVWLPSSYPAYPAYNWKQDVEDDPILDEWESLFTPAYLTGGNSAQSTSATWASVTDGSFKITIDGTDYNITGISFSGDSDMDDVAETIQAAIQAATGSSETCVWSTDHFIISSVLVLQTSEITVTSTVTSGTVGTDISGAGGTDWMDCDTGNGIVTNVNGWLTVSTAEYGGVSGLLYVTTKYPVVSVDIRLKYSPV